MYFLLLYMFLLMYEKLEFFFDFLNKIVFVGSIYFFFYYKNVWDVFLKFLIVGVFLIKNDLVFLGVILRDNFVESEDINIDDLCGFFEYFFIEKEVVLNCIVFNEFEEIDIYNWCRKLYKILNELNVDII